ncbi:hypothetical protein ACFE04_028486 [Oxalis oulophora]
MEGESSESTQSGSTLIKELASCNKTSRNRTLRLLLNTYLPSQTSISDEEMRKLWKGLFYCVWHSDKAPVQAALIDLLASQLLAFNLPMASHFFSAFLLTMRREWTGIDRLRLDKFYLLIRRFLHYMFKLLERNEWDLEISRMFIGILIDGTINANDDDFRGNGVNYHVANVFLEELRVFLPVKKEVLEVVVVDPFVAVLGKVNDKVLVGKIKNGLFDEFLSNGRKLLNGREELKGEGELNEDVVVLGSIGLVMGFAKRFYEAGSSVDCAQSNRSVLLGLHQSFLKLEADLVASKIQVSIPEAKVGQKEELVSKSVPNADGMEVDSSENLVNGEVLKKCENANNVAAENAKKSKKKKKKNKNKKEKDVVTNLNGGDGLSSNDNPENKTDSGVNSTDEQIADENLITLNDNIKANLQMQFEKVAAEIGTDNNIPSACDEPETQINGAVSKKRKRTKTKDGRKTQNSEPADQETAENGIAAKSADQSVKKVRFSMKNNIIWKPQTPLPPQSVRLPPSVTPRGSALKKGVSPGPIRVSPVVARKPKKARTVKKARKVVKSVGRS